MGLAHRRKQYRYPRLHTPLIALLKLSMLQFHSMIVVPKASSPDISQARGIRLPEKPTELNAFHDEQGTCGDNGIQKSTYNKTSEYINSYPARLCYYTSNTRFDSPGRRYALRHSHRIPPPPNDFRHFCARSAAPSSNISTFTVPGLNLVVLVSIK